MLIIDNRSHGTKWTWYSMNSNYNLVYIPSQIYELTIIDNKLHVWNIQIKLGTPALILRCYVHRAVASFTLPSVGARAACV